MTTGKKKLGRPRKISRNPGTKKNIYFGPEEQDAVIEYNTIDDVERKKELYAVTIYPAFKKLVEGLNQVYGFTKNASNPDEVISDCVNFLYENIHKFDDSKGTKAFSYYSVIARNWLTTSSRKRSKSRNRNVSLNDSENLSTYDKMKISTSQIQDAPDVLMMKSRQREEIVEMLQKIEKRLNKDYEKECIQALLSLTESLDDLDIIHKKAIYLYVRDISDLSVKQLTSAMSVIRSHYRDIVKKNLNG